MKPRFLLYGTVTNQPTLQKSRSNNDYVQADIETVWTEIENGQAVNICSTYRVIFYQQKALDFSSAIKQGDVIAVDCVLSAQTQNTNNGGHFINYSISGVKFERVRKRQGQQPPQQKPQQQPAQQPPRQGPPQQAPQQNYNQAPPNYPQPETGFNDVPYWGNSEDIPF